MKHQNNIDNFIKKTLYNLLKEETENSQSPDYKDDTDDNSNLKKQRQKKAKKSLKGVISTAGAFGSGGRSKKFVIEAGARAEKDPEGLMEDLGIKQKVSGADLEATLEILRKSIHSNIVRSEAYTGAKIAHENIKSSTGLAKKEIISITLNSIDRKNGIRFLAYTLKAAQNANFLDLQGGLQFSQSQESDIVIHSI